MKSGTEDVVMFSSGGLQTAAGRKGAGVGGLERTRKPRLSWKACLIKPSAGVMANLGCQRDTPGKEELK